MTLQEIRSEVVDLCRKSRMTDEEIADKAKITPTALSRYKTGKTNMRSDRLEALLNVLGKTLKAGKLRKK